MNSSSKIPFAWLLVLCLTSCQKNINDLMSNTCDVTPKHSDKLHIPGGLQGYFTMSEALACSKALKKPIFVQFTGHGMSSTREQEIMLYVDGGIPYFLKKNFIIVHLYTDDKAIISDSSDWIIKGSDTLKRLGNINSHYQANKYNSNSQPLFSVVDHNDSLMMTPFGYSLDADWIKDQLEQGLKTYETIY